MSEQRTDLRDELLAATAARRELSSDEEKYLVESFLDKLDREIDARVDARIEMKIASMPHRGGGMQPWVIPATLALAIPITAIAAVFAQWVGVLIALTFVVAVLGIYAGNSQK